MTRPTLGSLWTNAFPPKPGFLPKDLPDLAGKVYIVSGGNAGVGKELAKILYSKNATVYIAARNEAKVKAAIGEIEAAQTQSKGVLAFIRLDLADLSTIKASAETFLSRESKLHVLFNNAGCMHFDFEEKTAQGYEMNLGVNCLGNFLFTKYLTPVLKATAAAEEEGSVRVVWVSSSGTEIAGHEGVGLRLDNLDYKKKMEPGMIRYGNSKAGNWLHSVEFAKRHQADGIVSVGINPGNLSSDLYRNWGWLMGWFFHFVMAPSINGAYTELFAGLSPEVTLAQSGSWIIPWGRIYPIRKDLVGATRTKAEGGNGGAHEFWEWSEQQVEPYL